MINNDNIIGIYCNWFWLINSKRSIGYNTQFNRHNVHIKNLSVFLGFLLKGKYPGLFSPLCTQGTCCARPRGIILIESILIRWFSRRLTGRGWSFSLEAKSLKTTLTKTGRLEYTQIKWFLWQSGRKLVRVNGGCLFKGPHHATKGPSMYSQWEEYQTDNKRNSLGVDGKKSFKPEHHCCTPLHWPYKFPTECVVPVTVVVRLL